MVHTPVWQVRARLSSLAVGLAVVLGLASLVAVNRALLVADRTRASVDAAESAMLIESFLSIHVKALGGLRGLYVDGVDAERFGSFASVLTPHPLSGFRRVWVTDSAGVVVAQRSFIDDTVTTSTVLDIDTMSALGIERVARLARQTGYTQITGPGRVQSGERRFALIDPVVVDGEFAGFIVGTIDSDALLAAVLRGRESRHMTFTIRSGTDTIVGYRRQPTGPVEQASAAVSVPGVGRWRVEVAVARAGRWVQWGLWAVGLTTLAILLIGFSRERRTSRRVAERSSELERLSTELLHANRAKSEFLANISHELRTPLNAIVGFVDLLREGMYGALAPRQIGPVDRIAASATHLRHLVDQILDLGRIAAGRLDVHLEPVDLRAFVLDVIAEVEPLINDRGLSLSIGVGSTLPRVRTDPTHLRQILVNLLGNAVKFTPEGGIAVRSRLVGVIGQSGKFESFDPSAAQEAHAPHATTPWIALQVVDTGVGVAASDQSRIFDEFEQVNAGPRGDSMLRGTGLGLAISRRLARLLGGDVTLESDAGKGAVFTLWLPVHIADLERRGRGKAAV